MGKSSCPAGHTVEEMADAVQAILEHEGITRCIVLGHSMGGYAALVFAEKYPDLLAAMGLIHSHPYEDSFERKEIRSKVADL